MTAVTPESTADLGGRRAGSAAPSLVDAPWGARVVSLLFAVTVVLFVLAVVMLPLY